MWFKNTNTGIKNMNMKCAKQTWKWIFIMLTYVNMKMKRTWQGYGARSCLRLVLNKLKEMKGPTPIMPLWRPNSKELPRKFLCVHQVRKFLENLHN